MRKKILILSMICLPAALHAQNTGIGTTSPVNKLTVAGKADISDSLAIGTASPVARLQVNGDMLINNITVGKGNASQSFNTALGNSTLAGITTGNRNTGAGFNALIAVNTGGNNTAVGSYSLNATTTGSGNTVLGSGVLTSNITGSNNTGIGSGANTGSSNLNNATAIGANAIVNTNNSLVLGSNANVGIGVTAPSAKLEVAGTLNAETLQMTNGAASNLVLKTDAAGNAGWSTISSIFTETDPTIGTLTTNKLIQWNGTSFDNSLLFDNGTNVGINTTTPGARLQVMSGSNTAGVLVTSGATLSYTNYQLGRTSVDGTWGIAAFAGQFTNDALPGDVIFRTEQNTQKLILANGPSAAALVVSNGRVGIATQNAILKNKLDVRGSLGVGYAGYAPFSGISFANKVGIGTKSPVGYLELVVPGSTKSNPAETETAFFRTKESAGVTPFGLTVSTKGAADRHQEALTFHTSELGVIDGGSMNWQPSGGQTVIGSTVATPDVVLDVNGGIRSAYSGILYFQHAVSCGIGCSDFTMDFTLPFTLPAGSDFTNTVVVANAVHHEDPDPLAGQSVLNKFTGPIVARVINNTTIRIRMDCHECTTYTIGTPYDFQVNYIIFPLQP